MFYPNKMYRRLDKHEPPTILGTSGEPLVQNLHSDSREHRQDETEVNTTQPAKPKKDQRVFAGSREPQRRHCLYQLLTKPVLQ